MMVTYHVRVRSGSHEQTHKVEGEGSNLLQCFTSVINQIAESFPSSEGHEIIGVKTKKGGPLTL